ncbi:MAG TPA: histidine kinase [Thermoanaerobaculia bacterium]|nr:histidine kinase [Thermoanaerobaculia bacterium]
MQQQNRILAVAGLIAWAMAGVPVILRGADTPMRMAQWAVAFVLLAALFAADLRRPRLTFLALGALCVVDMVLLLCDGFEGALLVLIAMRLGSRVDRLMGLTWIGAQTILLAAAVAIHWNANAAWLLAPPYLGFQILAFFAFELMERERRTNAELRAVNDLVADGSRIAERLRISQELHDALGHRLTALTLRLEVALQRTEGEARGEVDRAQTIARALLADIRAIVAESQEHAAINLSQAVQSLVHDIPRPRVHVDLSPEVRVDDPERAHIILRCLQEIVTNAARHSSAENLWIAIERDGDQFRVRARDDGEGRSESRDGTGLRGMRSRIENAGGEMRVVDQPGEGFGIEAVLPIRRAAT